MQFCKKTKQTWTFSTICTWHPSEYDSYTPNFCSVDSVKYTGKQSEGYTITTLRLPRDNVKNGGQCFNNMHVRACQHSGCGYLSTQADCTTHFTHCTTSPVWFTLYRQVCTTRPARFTLYEQTTLRRITLSTSTTPALSMEKNGHKTQHRAGTLCPEAQICRNYPSGACT